MRNIKIVGGTYDDLGDEFGRIPAIDPRMLAVTALSRDDGSPLIDVWIEGDISYLSGDGFMDASGGMFMRVDGTNALSSGEINGMPALRLNSNGLRPPVGGKSGNLDAFSAFFVVQNKGDTSTNRYLLSSTNSSLVGSLTTILTPTSFSTYVGGDTATTLRHNETDYLDENPKLLAVTFSVENGTTLRRNGVEVASNPGRTAKIADEGDILLFCSIYPAGRFNGDVGNAFFISGYDLSVNPYALQVIEGYLLDRWQIAKGG